MTRGPALCGQHELGVPAQEAHVRALDRPQGRVVVDPDVHVALDGVVAGIAVHAVPAELGEDDIKVCIVPAPGGAPTPEQLFEFFRRCLPYYAIPRYLEFVDELPANVYGRVQKFVLRERAITETTLDFQELNLVVARPERRAA